MNQSLADIAYEAIKADILNGALLPGQQIGQAQIAEEKKLGITPTREALQRLTKDGLVEPIPRYGYIITPISLSDVNELYEMRSMAEPISARLAAERASEAERDKILAEADFTYVHKCPETYAEYLAANTKFHRVIAAASGNRRLVELISHLLDESTRLFQLVLDLRDAAHTMRDEHVTIAQAIYERDADRAEKLAKIQMADSKRRVLEALMRRADSGHILLGSREIHI